jgi:hypothetical protein
MLIVSRAFLTALAALAATLLLAAPANAAPAVDGEFTIPGGVGSNNYIVEGPDGNMWVTLQNVNGVARITPDGTVTEFTLANTSFGIAVGPDNNLWVSTTIGVIRVPPADPASATAFNDIGLVNGQGITAGPDGRMWVAGDGELISFDPASPDTTEVETAITGLQPRGVDTGSDGLIWIAGANGNVYSATATPTPTVTPHDIQIGAAGGAQDVGAGPNGQVAYAAPTTDPQSVGRISPGGTPLKTELTASDPFGVTFAPDGAYWIARAGTNDLLRLTPEGETTMLTGFAPSGGVGPRKIAPGPNDTLWVTLDTPEKVARVTGVSAPPPPVTEPSTEIDKTPKKKLKAKDKKNGKKGTAKAKFKFSSPTAGVTFECSLQKKAKKAKFRACKSPAKYKLKPGKYEFAVRAVLAGSPDPSPETFALKVVRKKR